MKEKAAEARTLIREAFLRQGISVADWARQMNVPPVRVYQTIARACAGQKVTSPTVWRILQGIKHDAGVDLTRS